jgi:hypothetical protein
MHCLWHVSNNPPHHTENIFIFCTDKLPSLNPRTEILPGTKIHHQPNIIEDWEYVEFREGYKLHFVPLEGDDEDSNLRELIVGVRTVSLGCNGLPNIIGIHFTLIIIHEYYPTY